MTDGGFWSYKLTVSDPETGAVYPFLVAERRHVSPSQVMQWAEKFQEAAGEAIPLLYAPSISPRVGELITKLGFSYLDSGGNCRLYRRNPAFLVDRQGRAVVDPANDTVIDPFAPRASRIVRALLSDPRRTWTTRDMAHDAAVRVSVGLVSKVKQALAEQAFIEPQRRGIQLRDALGLLRAWENSYPRPHVLQGFYGRGSVESLEARFLEWCRRHDLIAALAGLSAAWRLVPHVRHNVATAYLEEIDRFQAKLKMLADEEDIHPTDQGANLVVWVPYDESVFSGRQFLDEPELSTTSPLQTYLDCMQWTPRGTEAAEEIYDRFLQAQLSSPNEDNKVVR
ncbi:MAG: type IV toxin-antitoxin system AbiEi family antitoxin [Pirellulaceae bacterium]